MPDKSIRKVETMADLVEQVIFLTRRVHEFERRLEVPHEVVAGHAAGLAEKLYFRKEIN